MSETREPAITAMSAPPPSFADALATWAKIGVLSFGGPAGQIALMHRVLVDEKKWIDERSYLSALNFCMLLPGPEAMQLATYVGWRLHGVAGGLAAGLLFVLPGAAVVLALSLAYAAFGQLPLVTALFTGVKAAVFAIVIEALLRVAKRALRSTAAWWIAAAAFVAIYALAVPFPVIVVAAAVFGSIFITTAAPEAPVTAARVNPLRTVGTIAIWGALWIVPLVGLALALGTEHVLVQIGWFFSKLAVVTFGGAYAVLAYMAQEVVQNYRWLKPGEMVDGLGLAETTPGPLILVTQFVGTIAAYRAAPDMPVLAGVAGAATTLWATFVPCFLWIFACAPYIERLGAIGWLRSALQGVTAAVVGVILNLTVWFALHVLFTELTTFTAGPVSVLVPELSSLAPRAAALCALSVVMMFVLHRGVLTTLAVSAAVALVVDRLL